VKVCGQIPKGFPPLVLPQNFNEKFPTLFSNAIPIVIVGFLVTLSIENHFAIRRKYQVMRLD
jgi:SulP family sulfate permease